MVKINIYFGDQLGQGIDEAINNYNWDSATGTANKTTQWSLIYQGITKTFPDITNVGTRFRDIHPVSSGLAEVHIGVGGAVFPARSFNFPKAAPPQHFAYNFPSKHGTYVIEYTYQNGISSITPFEAENMFNEWLAQKELTQPEPIPEPIPEPPVEVPVITEPEPIPEPPVEVPVITEPVYVPAIPIIQPTVDDSINTNMVTQQMINFNIVNGRAVGSIKFVATNNFNPYYYGKNIINIIMFKDPNGANILTTVKTNNLNFTETERDEVINYSEDMQGNTRATVESFVWEWIDKPAGAFSKMYSIEISEAEPPKPIQSGFLGAGYAGAIAGLVLLGFIIDHKVSKR